MVQFHVLCRVDPSSTVFKSTNGSDKFYKFGLFDTNIIKYSENKIHQYLNIELWMISFSKANNLFSIKLNN